MELLQMKSVVGVYRYTRPNLRPNTSVCTQLSISTLRAQGRNSRIASRTLCTHSKMPGGADGITVPLDNLRVSEHIIPRHARFPNCSIQDKPLVIYHGVFEPAATASQIEAHLRKVGVMEPQWRYTMYSTSHFHSTTHEFLCIAAGRALLCFGGEGNPNRVEAEVEKGDAVLVPAGVAHRLLDDLRGGFQMVGSYPKGGAQWDMCYGREGEEDAVERISNLEWLHGDPIYGDNGPAVKGCNQNH